MRLWWLMLLFVDGRCGFSPVMRASSVGDPLEGAWRLVGFERPGVEASRMDKYRDMVLRLGRSCDDIRCGTLEFHGSVLSGSVCSSRVDRIVIRKPPSKTPHFRDMMRLLPKVIEISRKGLDINLSTTDNDILRIDVIDQDPPLTLFFERTIT